MLGINTVLGRDDGFAAEETLCKAETFSTRVPIALSMESSREARPETSSTLLIWDMISVNCPTATCGPHTSGTSPRGIVTIGPVQVGLTDLQLLDMVDSFPAIGELAGHTGLEAIRTLGNLTVAPNFSCSTVLAGRGG